MIRARPTRTLAAAALALAIAAPGASGKGSPPDAIRIGGPSAPNEAKVAIVGSDRSLRRHRFRVLAANGETVLRGRLKRAPGKPDPWRHAYAADLSSIARPGSYRVVVGRLHSPAWRVDVSGGRMPLLSILQFFAANRDGDEPSPIHGPAHLNDAIVHPDAPVHAGERIGIAGGWMDAGDTLHFTQTTAFAAALLQAAALLDPTDAAALEEEADVGIRWLVKAHPAPDLFIAQVGDERDHDLGFRDPADDDASAKPGIGTRFAYPEIGGDLGGKAAAALALAYRRTGDLALLTAAQEWYAAGKAAGRAARPLRQAGYPAYAGNFYAGDLWQDSLAAGAVELYRATCAAGVCVGTYLDDFRALIAGPPGARRQPRGDRLVRVLRRRRRLRRLRRRAAARGSGHHRLRRPAPQREDRRGQARGNAFGMPGYFSWGTTATNGGSGALAALATATPRGLPRGCEVAAGARDYLLGRNPFGRSFVVGYGRRSARHPHTWASVFGAVKPRGAVVGGPAPRGQVSGQGFKARGRLNSGFAAYEDRLDDYVTSEPAIDYAAASVLMLAALTGSLLSTNPFP